MQDVITILQLFPYLLLAWANRAKKTKGEIERREGRVGGGGEGGGELCRPVLFPSYSRIALLANLFSRVSPLRSLLTG